MLTVYFWLMPGIRKILSSAGRLTANAFLVLFIILLIVAGLVTIFSPPVTESDIAVAGVSGTLEVKPEVHSYGRDRYIRLLLTEYPNRSFNIDGDAYNATKWVPLTEDVNAGDEVQMEVSAEDNKNSIERERVPERMMPVAVYALRSKGVAYLSLADYCKEANSNTGAGVVALVMGVLLGIALYFQLRGNRKKRRAR